jgi:hypothetical protein
LFVCCAAHWQRLRERYLYCSVECIGEQFWVDILCVDDRAADEQLHFVRDHIELLVNLVLDSE